jgi:hypothetical protein
MQQTMSRPQPNMQPNNPNNGPARTQSLIITAITLFALSGLIIGFATGAATRPPQAAQPTAAPTTNAIAKQTQPSPTQATAQPVPLGCPIIDQADGAGFADGTSTYGLQMHAVDKSGKCAQSGNPVKEPGITCKLWLTKDTDTAIKGTAAVWNNIDTVKQQPIAGEVTGALNFNSGTQQTQMCNSQGQASWKFSVSPNVKHGDYFLVVLTDWNGKYYNLSWWPFTVKKAG